MKTRGHAWVFALASGLVAASCGDDDDDGSRLAELARIGEEGGTFAIEGLAGVVPEGAVEDGSTAVITGEIAEGVTPPPGAVGPVFELEIDQQLREPITLELFYELEALGGRSPLALRVASSRDGLVWDCEPMTAPREQTGSVLATVNHLSFWVLRFNPCGGNGDCASPETCFNPGPDGFCAMPCAGDADCPSPTFCQCGICSRVSCAPPEDDCPAATDCSVEQGRGVCLPECTPFDRCGDPEEQQLCSPGGRCAFQQSALCPNLFSCDDDDSCVHQWCVPDDSGCVCGDDPGCTCETPSDLCPPVDHEACGNGEDDDGDALIDCFDLDCADEPGCTAGTPEDCAATGDEDGDGLEGCDDPDCAGDVVCGGDDVRFFDGTFADIDWTIASIEAAGNPPAPTAGQRLDGGNPGAYRAMTHEFVESVGAESIRVFHRLRGATYDPSVQGAIETIDFGLDHLGERDVGEGFVVYQDNELYVAEYEIVPGGAAWTERTSAGLRAADFRNGADESPDFTATGTTLQFGFLLANSTTAPTPTLSIAHGADNFAATLHRAGGAGGPWAIEVTAYGRRNTRAATPEDVDWLAFQDGDGAWNELGGDGSGVYRATVQDPDGRYGVAWGCGVGRTSVSVQYAVATEGVTLRIPGCFPAEGAPLSRVSGTVIGGDCYTINVHTQTLAPCYIANYFADVVGGPVDVFAASAPPGDIFDRAFLQRDIPVAGPTNVTIDFDGADAFDLERHSRSGANVWISFRSINESHLTFGFGSELLEYGGVPVARQVAGEGHTAFVAGVGAIETIYFRAPVDLVASAAPPAAPIATGAELAEVPYRLISVDAGVLPVGASALEVSVTSAGPSWVVRATAPWLDGRTSIETPDLSGVPSWLDQYGLPDAFNATLNVYWVAPDDLIECLNAPAQIGLAPEGLRCLVGSSQVSFP